MADENLHAVTNDPAWTDQVAAWSALATAVLTLVLVLMAVAAWRTAKHTLDASRRASEAATASAEAAKAANEQARLDSIEQTRPYVYVEILPGLSGQTTYDVRITNSGRSAARELTISYDSWPGEMDDVSRAIRDLFATPRTLPPACSIRSLWRLEGNFDDGTTVAGLGKDGTITVRYTSCDPSSPGYVDSFGVTIENSGLWPIPEAGPNPDGVRGDALKFYRLGQALVRRVGELAR
ncbi:hypothetical protein [Nocardioides sp. InS609-2]|uniref:hypothetical protein n=1 Tax=Nocardioides sp. InS609-2 TaxID=2760705 RepID=UPI0020BF7CF6|nr:hypothetical protein [Nocardioides sp. InS609-2]